MPNYDWQCDRCHTQTEIYESLKAFGAIRYYCEVRDCGGTLQRLITAPALVSAQPECRYTSPIDDRVITNYAQRADDLARHDCVPYDPELKKDQVRNQQARDTALDKSVDESVAATWAKMPTKARGKIASELVQQGTTIKIERSTPVL